MARINPKGERRGPARSFLGALDTYVKPERDVSGAQALQQGLGQLGNALGNASSKLKKEQDEAHYQQGKADYLRTAVGKEPEGIKKGILFRGQSKFYQMGLAEAQGEAKAIDWANGLTTAYKSWDGRGSSDPDAFRSWMNEQSADFLKGMGEDTHALGAAMPYINRANQNMAKHHVTYRDGQMKIARFNAFNTKIADTMDQFETNSLSGDAMADVFENQVQLMIGTGENGAEVINSIITQATQHANAYDNPEILKAIAKLHDDGKFRLSKSNQAQIADANDKVENDILRRDRIDKARAKDLSDRAEAEVMGNWASALTEDEYTDMPDANSVHPDVYKEMGLLQDAVIKAKTRISSEQEAANSIAMDAILNDPSLSDKDKVKAIVSYGKDNPVKDISDYIKMANAEADPDAIWNSKPFKERKDAFLTSLNAGFNKILNFTGQTAATTASVRMEYDKYVFRFGGAVDKNDANALYELSAKAEEFALKAVYSLDAKAFDDLDNDLIRKQLGIEGIKEVVNGEIAEKKRIKLEADAQKYKEALTGVNSMQPSNEYGGTFEPEVKAVVEPEAVAEVKAVVEPEVDTSTQDRIAEEDLAFAQDVPQGGETNYPFDSALSPEAAAEYASKVTNAVKEAVAEPEVKADPISIPDEKTMRKYNADIETIVNQVPKGKTLEEKVSMVKKAFMNLNPKLHSTFSEEDLEFLISSSITNRT